VSDENIATIGGMKRTLVEILTEGADGRSELIYFG